MTPATIGSVSSNEGAPAAKPAPSLSKALSKRTRPTMWIEFKKLRLKVRFMPRAIFKSMYESNTELKYDEKAKERRYVVNNEAFVSAFLKEAVLEWENVSLRTLSNIIEIDIEGYTAEELDAPLPFSTEDLKNIMDSAFDLDEFLNKTVVDISLFRPALEENTKN